MKTIDETLCWILDSIGHVYWRPSMYASTKRGLDCVLWTYHSIWAFIVDKDGDFRDARIESLGGKNTDDHLIGESDNPPTRDFNSIIERWKWIDARLGIVVPDKAL